MMKMFKVSSQGLNRDLSAANGDYDTVELGEMSEDALYDAFRKLKVIEELIPDKNQDLCPAALYVSYNGNDYNFYLNNHEIVCGNNEVTMSPMEAVQMVQGLTDKHEIAEEAVKESAAQPSAKGKKGSKALAWGSDHPDVEGMMPVRKENLPPTDKNEISRFNINTSDKNPHISMEVYKSDLMAGLVQAALLFGIFVLVMALGLLATGEASGVVFLLVALILFWLRKKIKTGWGRTILRIGFDWKCNGLWIKKENEKEAAMVANANCITSFSLSEHKEVRQGRQYFDKPGGTRAMQYNYTDKSWLLLANMSNNTNKLVFVFEDKKLAKQALEKVQALLNQQN